MQHIEKKLQSLSNSGEIFVVTPDGNQIRYQLTDEAPMCNIYIEKAGFFFFNSKDAFLERKANSLYMELLRTIDALGQENEEKGKSMLSLLGLFEAAE